MLEVFLAFPKKLSFNNFKLFFENPQRIPGRFYVFGFFSDTKRAQKRRKQNGGKKGASKTGAKMGAKKGAKQFGDTAYKPGEKKTQAKWRDASKMAQAKWRKHYGPRNGGNRNKNLLRTKPKTEK